MKPAARRSGLQGDVLSLYRNLLRVGKTKEEVGVQSHIQQKFREDASSIKRSDFKKIEHLLRQGHKKLKILKLPGTKLVGYGTSTSRSFSTIAAVDSSIQWDRTSRPRAHIVSLGCGRNWVDSEVMLGDFLRAGYEIESSDPSKADLIVVNTCGFLKSARDEGDDEIQRVLTAKLDRASQGMATSVVVTGCMVNLDKEAVLERHPAIDHLVGAAGIGEVLQVIERKQRMYSIPTSSQDRRSHLEDEILLKTALNTGEAPPARLLATPPHLAYLKIAEGCRKRCTFCIIPIIKGALRSKPIPQVVKEFRSLVSGGVREVALIAQDLGDYGKDSDQTPIGANIELSSQTAVSGDEDSVTSKTIELLKLLQQIGEVGKEHHSWIRLLYLYPDEISKELLMLMEDKMILPYLDMPMQHVSTSVLRRMGRKSKYDRAALEQTITMIQNTKTPVTECGVSLSPWRNAKTGLGGVSLRTTLMVGFPGETEADFQELLEFLNGPFGQTLTHIGVFAFSAEAQARAATFDNQVAESVKRRRKRQVEAVYSRNLRKRQQLLVDEGRLIVVLVDHVQSDQSVVGRHPGQALGVDGVVEVKFGPAQEGKAPKAGDVVVAKVTGYSGANLIAHFDRLLKEETYFVQ